MAEFRPMDVIYHVKSNRKGTGVDISYMKELIRCKDCRWRHDDSFTAWLPCNEVMTDDDWYCGYAERIDAE